MTVAKAVKAALDIKRWRGVVITAAQNALTR